MGGRERGTDFWERCRRLIGDLALEAVYSPTVAFPWRNPTTLVVNSFRGKMDFAYVSNTGFLSYEDAMAIKEEVMEVLRKVTRGAGVTRGVGVMPHVAVTPDVAANADLK